MSEEQQNGLSVSPATASLPAESAVMAAAKAIPFRLAVAVPVPAVTLRRLGGLRPGQTFQTEVPAADDVPVAVGGALFAWAELDSAGGQMAVRLTRFR